MRRKLTRKDFWWSEQEWHDVSVAEAVVLAAFQNVVLIISAAPDGIVSRKQGLPIQATKTKAHILYSTCHQSSHST